MTAFLLSLAPTTWLYVGGAIAAAVIAWRLVRIIRKAERADQYETELEERERNDARIRDAQSARRNADAGELHEDDGHRRD